MSWHNQLFIMSDLFYGIIKKALKNERFLFENMVGCGGF